MRGRPLKPLATDEAKRDRLTQILLEESERTLLIAWAETIPGLADAIASDALQKACQRVPKAKLLAEAEVFRQEDDSPPESAPVPEPEPAEPPAPIIATAPAALSAAHAQAIEKALEKLEPRQRAYIEALRRKLA